MDEHLTDEELAVLVQKDDAEKFGILMNRYHPKLFRYGKKFLSNSDNIEDALQEVFIKTYRNIKSFDPAQKFSPWIYRIAHNTFINSIKKSARGPLYFFDFDTLVSHKVEEPTYEDTLEKEREQIDTKKLIDSGLDRLKPKLREALVLYYIEELGYKEIAEILRIPIGTVGIRIQRGKQKLKEYFEQNGSIMRDKNATASDE